MYEISEELDQEPHSGRKEIDQELHRELLLIFLLIKKP